jgi:hypothetical protein
MAQTPQGTKPKTPPVKPGGVHFEEIAQQTGLSVLNIIKRCFRATRLCRAVTGVSRLYMGRQAGPMGSKDLYVSTNSWCPRLSEQLCVPEATSSTFL